MSTVVITDEGDTSVGVSETVETVIIDEGTGSPGPPGPPGPGGGGDLISTNNLSDLDDPAVARDNLGLDTAATRPASDFADAADLIAEQSERITDVTGLQADIDAIVVGGAGDMLSTNFASEYVGHEPEVQANLGLGSAATADATEFSTPAELDALTNALRQAAYRDVGTTSSTVASGDAPQAAVDAIPTVDTTDNTKAFFDTQDVGGGELVTFLDVTNLASLDDIVAGGGGVASVNGEVGAVSLVAADVPFTPVGTIAATTTQAAIQEVAAEAAGGGLLYTFTQDVASALWTVGHNLGAYLNVTVVDSLIRQVEADVQYVDVDTVTIGFAVPTTGQAFLS